MFVDLLSLEKRSQLISQIRDRQCSASQGLPVRIRDEDCDVEMLEPQDFEDEGFATAPRTSGTHVPEHALYLMQMVKLAIIRPCIPCITSTID